VLLPLNPVMPKKVPPIVTVQAPWLAQMSVAPLEFNQLIWVLHE
jgi:hypothetical protein